MPWKCIFYAQFTRHRTGGVRFGWESICGVTDPGAEVLQCCQPFVVSNCDFSILAVSCRSNVHFIHLLLKYHCRVLDM